MDLTGKRFGRWLVLEETSERRKGNVMWLCKCDCGTVRTVSASTLKTGKSVSCGCYNKEVITTHGKTHSRLYHTWTSMVRRCTDPNSPEADGYINRGIKVCDEWLNSFEAFRDWATENGYQDGLSIDRINNNGNYEPSNCRWATAKEQSRNRRSNVILTYNGESHCMVEWAEILKVPRDRLANRYRRGWPTKEILFGRS